MRKILLFLVTAFSSYVSASDVVWFDGTHPITYTIDKKAAPVIMTALDMFCDDMLQVTGMTPVESRKGTIVIVQGNGHDDGFDIHVDHGRIIVKGHNARGTAYGLLELAREAGVSPWIWWGDVVPERRERLSLPEDYNISHVPSVEYRGIFINDEDWSTRHWSYTTHAPAAPGIISAKTYKRIFQLLLRLRANAVWPAMHEGTMAFFKTPGAKAVADSCGMVIGTSHCEPLLRNNVGEWDAKARGAFNYRTNRQAVQDYWIERLREVHSSRGNMFTIGMRGIHDSSMEGYTTTEEKFEALQQVIDDQQRLLRQYIGDPQKQMQVFVPYKEVLTLYEQGLRIPEHVTLLWCDDNYGYMTRFSNLQEQSRSGGGGLYYHLSYWGRPHDYLWLTTTSPGLIYNEMLEAYEHNMRKLWVANVHDPKVAGYDLELFLDLAWDIQSVHSGHLSDHLGAWLRRQFGTEAGDMLLPAMKEFYHLCTERKPEFMGWNQVELDKRIYDRGLSPVRNSELSATAFGNELDRYLDRYKKIAETVEDASEKIRPQLRDAFFAAIQYPVKGACAHTEKILEAQKARQLANGSTLQTMHQNHQALYQSVAKSQKAYARLQYLTRHYNEMANGKWRNAMNDHPRDLPVFWAPLLPFTLSDAEVDTWAGKGAQSAPYPLPSGGVVARNACDYDYVNMPVRKIEMLGHSMNAVALPEGAEMTYRFEIPQTGDYVLHTALIPTHPCDAGDLRFSVSIDGGTPVVYSLKEPFRSEQWKINVLRGQARRQHRVTLSAGNHTLTLRALDHHVIIDQWMLDPVVNRQFYLFPLNCKH